MSVRAAPPVLSTRPGGNRRPQVVFFIFLLASLFWSLALAGAVRADEKEYPGLADGLETMSAFRGAHPKADDAYQKLVERAPASVRTQVQASDWAAHQRNMTAEQLDAAVEDPNMRIIPTANGLAVVPADKLKNGINALTDFAIDQDETAGFVRTARDRMPASMFGSPEDHEDFKDRAGKVAEHLDGMRPGNSGVYATGKRIAIKAIVSVAATAKIDQLSGEIKNRIINEGADKVLDDYRRAAEERKRKVAEQLEKAKAARDAKDKAAAKREQKPPEGSPATDGKRRSKGEWLRSADENLGLVERLLDSLKGKVDACNAVMNQLPDLQGAEPEGVFLGDTGALVAAEKQLGEAERLINGADALKTFIEQAKAAAQTACRVDASSATGESDAENRKRQLEKTRAVARGVYEALKAQLDATIAKLKGPLDLGRLGPRVAKLTAYKNACQSNQAAANSALADLMKQTSQDPDEEMAWAKFYINKAKKHVSGTLDMDILAYETRAAALEARHQAIQREAWPCRQKAQAYGKCQEALKGDKVGELEKAIQRADAIKDKRADMQKRLTDLLGRIEKDYSATKEAVERGKGCNAAPRDQQTACDPKEIEEAFKAANADYYKENFAAAKAALQTIGVKYGRCPSVPDRVAKGDAIIDKVVNAKTKIDSAIANCDVPKMESYIAQMQALSSPHPSMPAWIANMRAKLPQCRGTQTANADAECRSRDGPGYRASIQADGAFYCVPGKSAADNWCQVNNATGWYAGPVGATGTFDCYPGNQARTDRCRTRHGSAARAGKIRKDGSYTCYVPRPRTKTSQPRPKKRAPSTGPTAGEVIGGVIAEVIKSQTSKKKKPRKRKPGRKCHRRRDGTIHCGSG